jgi:N-alpha-acetyltransferase 30
MRTLTVGGVRVQYADERDIELVTRLIDPELSEPYSIFTYRFFLTPWPNLCHFCYVDGEPAGVVVGKVDDHKSGRRRGYIGMVVVNQPYRKMGIGACRVPASRVRWTHAA